MYIHCQLKLSFENKFLKTKNWNLFSFILVLKLIYFYCFQATICLFYFISDKDWKGPEHPVAFLACNSTWKLICIAISFFLGFVELLSTVCWIINAILNFQQKNRSSNTLLISNSELETFLPLGDHAHRWQWGMERVMIIWCGRWRQATTTSAGPPHCWRPHQLCKQNSILFIVLSVDFAFTRATLNSKLAWKWKSRHRGKLRRKNSLYIHTDSWEQVRMCVSLQYRSDNNHQAIWSRVKYLENEQLGVKKKKLNILRKSRNLIKSL